MMIYIKRIFAAIAAAIISIPGFAVDKKSVNVFDHVAFYDGYLDQLVDYAKDDGIYRLKNSLYSKKLNTEDFRGVGDDLSLDVTIGALCDNYDRIGSLFLVFVPKGADRYKFDDVRRIEIARLITPFMNKNVSPTEVPYSYNIPNVARILRDRDLTAQYDFWVELELFGVPYSANSQVKGCEGRKDVFEATVNFCFTEGEQTADTGNIIIPIYVKTPDEAGNVNLNNYNEMATDTIGQTTRTFEFEVSEDVADSKIYLILTNHGANSNGEEYVRRLHLVYYDGDIILTYTPGGVSCEPYRQYNTQENGIYSYGRSESFWKTQSNWCPGQGVPIREISLGAQKAGKHKVMIRVPSARFYQKEGDFRPSLYFHGVTTGQLPASVETQWFEGPEIKLSRSGDYLQYTADEEIAAIAIHTYDGKLIDVIKAPSGSIPTGSYPKGLLIVSFVAPNGAVTTRPVLLD